MCGSIVDIQSPVAEIRPGKKIELECGPMPNLDGRPAEHRWRPLINAAKLG